MINIQQAEKYCNDYIKIENYEMALNDDTQRYICHHKKGITLNCGPKKLKELGLYYDRPPEELIFVTFAEHNKLHHNGRKPSEESKRKMSEARKGKKPRAIECIINGKTYGCIKEAWLDINPELSYFKFWCKYKNGRL